MSVGGITYLTLAKFYNVDIRSEDTSKDNTRRKNRPYKPPCSSDICARVSENHLFDADVNIVELLNILEFVVRAYTEKIIFISFWRSHLMANSRIFHHRGLQSQALLSYTISKAVSEYLRFYNHQYDPRHILQERQGLYYPYLWIIF